MESRIKLYGFNNLTKSLSFNMYDICYAKTVDDRNAYFAYIDEQYNAERLTNILRNMTQIIGATVLNIAKQDYDPQGSSVSILICEEPTVPGGGTAVHDETPGPVPQTMSRCIPTPSITPTAAFAPSGWI